MQIAQQLDQGCLLRQSRLNLPNGDTQRSSGFAESRDLTSEAGLQLLDFGREFFFLGRALFLGSVGQILRYVQVRLRQPLLG